MELRIKRKNDTMRHLQSTSVYKKKINLIELKDLISQYKEAGRNALEDLLVLMKQRTDSINMEMLLRNLNISFELFGYDPESEEFT